MQAKKTKNDLQDKDLLRYNRNILLPEIDIEGQTLLSNARVAIIGLGGIGCPTATYLTSSGIGNLCLVDFDKVSLSNLNRQVLFKENDIASMKVLAAKRNLELLNSKIHIETISKKVNSEFDKNLLKGYDYIIDCTDNFQARAMINDITLYHKLPLITGAAIKFEGQISTFRNDLSDMPCYRCLYPDLPSTSQTCLDSGVLGSVTGLIGTMLATECIKLICNIGEQFISKLMLIDLKTYQFRVIKINKDKECKHCG